MINESNEFFQAITSLLDKINFFFSNYCQIIVLIIIILKKDYMENSINGASKIPGDKNLAAYIHSSKLSMA